MLRVQACFKLARVCTPRDKLKPTGRNLGRVCKSKLVHVFYMPCNRIHNKRPPLHRSERERGREKEIERGGERKKESEKDGENEERLECRNAL